MSPETVDNEWFIAEFPSSVETTVEPKNDGAQTTEFAAELQPFGIFLIRATQMPIDPFIAVGPRGWIQTFGDGLLQKLTSYQPQVIDDQLDTPLGGAIRQLVLRINYEGPCGVFARIFAHSDGEVGRVLECSAIVELGKDWQAMAFRFLNSVKPKWSPSR